MPHEDTSNLNFINLSEGFDGSDVGDPFFGELSRDGDLVLKLLGEIPQTFAINHGKDSHWRHVTQRNA